MSDGEILTPTCPLCSGPPVLVLGGGHQAFCGNDDCPALNWDMFLPLDTLLTSFTSVELPDLGPGTTITFDWGGAEDEPTHG